MPTPPTERFIAVTKSDRPDTFAFKVRPNHCVGPGGTAFLFGGVTMGAGVTALEAACGRNLVWASAQYVGPAHPGDEVQLTVSKSREGKGITIAEVLVEAAKGPVSRITAALGSGREAGQRQWRQMPKVPAPDSLPDGRHWRAGTGLHGEMEVKVAHGRYGLDRIGNPTADGRLVFWIRPRHYRIDKAYLATIADLVPTGIGNALGTHSGGRSLDNTFRCLALHETDWVLAEVSISAIDAGLVYGNIGLFSRDGKLMALGSQTLVLVHHN